MKTRPHLVTLIPLLAANMIIASAGQTAWEALLTEKLKTQDAFAHVENDPALPNVFIYGDSISIGYTPRVREQLAGKANVYRLHTNGGDSSSFIPKMRDLHATMKAHWDFDWDVIHFNVGLHDLKYVVDGKLDKVNGEQVNSTAVYRRNLIEIIGYLKTLAPRAKLIFATTTPVPEGEPGRVAGDAKRYNQAALDVLKQYPDIMVNDLYGFTKPKQPDWWTKPGNVHFEEVGRNAQGDRVAEVILKALK